MTFLAALWGLAALWALVTGRAAWFRRSVARKDEPIPYWSSVVICLAMACLFASLGPVR